MDARDKRGHDGGNRSLSANFSAIPAKSHDGRCFGHTKLRASTDSANPAGRTDFCDGGRIVHRINQNIRLTWRRLVRADGRGVHSAARRRRAAEEGRETCRHVDVPYFSAAHFADIDLPQLVLSGHELPEFEPEFVQEFDVPELDVPGVDVPEPKLEAPKGDPKSDRTVPDKQ